MIVQIIVMSVISIFFIRMYSVTVELRQLLKEEGIVKKDYIQYDLRDEKYYFYILLMSVAGMGHSILSAVLYGLFNIVTSFIYYCLLVIYLVIFIISIIKGIKIHAYIAGLKKEGYIAPDKKEEYDFLHSRLVIKGSNTLEEGEAETNKASIISSLILIIIFSVLIIYNLLFARKYYFVTDSQTLAMLMGIADLSWILAAVICYRNSDNRKYKYPYQSAQGRKNRLSTPAFVMCMIIAGLITFFVKSTCDSMTRYIVKSNISLNLQYEDQIKLAFTEVEEEGIEIPKELLKELKTGVDITEWKDNCDYTHELLKKMDMESFEVLREKIKNKIDIPEVIVKYKNGKYEVEIKNVYKD